mgnify:CR=1 FL=1
MKLLLIEDDLSLVTQLTQQLAASGYTVDSSTDGEDGLYRAREYTYDLLVVDVGLPILSGIDVIEQLRRDGNSTPILVLTARSSWQDKVYGLNAGADDYLVKPFHHEELEARIQALIRRVGGYCQSIIKQGQLSLDIESQEVRLAEQALNLTGFEYKLLEYFMLHPNKVASKSVLADYLYAEEMDRDSNVIEVIVARLRQKIDPGNQWKPIETLRGRGYRFVGR